MERRNKMKQQISYQRQLRELSVIYDMEYSALRKQYQNFNNMNNNGVRHGAMKRTLEFLVEYDKRINKK
jgi:hypothetical protein